MFRHHSRERERKKENRQLSSNTQDVYLQSVQQHKNSSFTLLSCSHLFCLRNLFPNCSINFYRYLSSNAHRCKTQNILKSTNLQYMSHQFILFTYNISSSLYGRFYSTSSNQKRQSIVLYRSCLPNSCFCNSTQFIFSSSSPQSSVLLSASHSSTISINMEISLFIDTYSMDCGILNADHNSDKP